MWLVLSLVASGFAVGVAFLLRYAYNNQMLQYSKLSNKNKNGQYRASHKNTGSEDGYVFVCSNENIDGYQNVAFEDNFGKSTRSSLRSDSDCELIEEIDSIIPTSYDEFT